MAAMVILYYKRRIMMVLGTVGHLNPRENELWEILLGLRETYGVRVNKVELETESAKELRVWEDWRWLIKQLN